jgi:response regulator RpfG family c-di-GMP phosphodiesterase
VSADPNLIIALLSLFFALVFLGLWLSARRKLSEGKVAAQGAASASKSAIQTAGDDRLVAITEEMVATQKEVIITLSELVEFRARESATHVERVAEFAGIFATALGLEASEALLLTEAAPMHDLGKIGLPDYIIHKPGALTTDELTVMRSHTKIGHDILAKHDRPLFRMAATIALEHHERWDGSGYPRGLRGDSISMAGRIVALCDVFDSLSNARPYKDAWPLEKTVKFIEDGAGHHFDPALVEVMTKNMDKFLKILVAKRDR